MPQSEEAFPHYEPVRFEFQKWVDAREAARRAASALPGYISESELAAQLHVAVSTVRRWRRKRYGPQAITIGRKFYYPEDAAQTFADELLKQAEAERESPRRGRPRGRR